jgi:hypothetical protein
MSSTRASKRKGAPAERTSASKRQPWHKTDPPKYVQGLDMGTLHPIHQGMVKATVEMLSVRNAAYIVAPAGAGKTTTVSAMFAPCSDEKVWLNVVVLPNASLISSMKEHIPTSVPSSISPFGDSAKETALHTLIQDAKEGQTVSIMVTHDFLHKKLSPTAKYPFADFKKFLRDVGKPGGVRLFIDEAHNLGSNAKWGELLSKLRAEAKTVFQVVLLSATSNLDKALILRNTANLLGVTPEMVSTEMLVALPQEDVAQFKRDTSLLPLPDAGWVRKELPLPYPNERLAGLLEDALEDLGVLLVGNQLYKLGRYMKGMTRKKEVHAHVAMNNIVAEIVAIVAHHSSNGEATGGPLFSNLNSTVNATRIKNAKVCTQKPFHADECALVVHGNGRGVKTHMRLLEELQGGADGVHEFSPIDLSLAASNRARAEANRDKFFHGIFEAKDGIRLGVLTPKQTEGTNDFTAFVTKIVLIGPMTESAKMQTRRTDRPMSGKEVSSLEGKRVREDKTIMLHLDSQWARDIVTAEQLHKSPDTLDAPEEVVQRLRAFRDAKGSEYDASAVKLIAQMAMALVVVEGRGVGAFKGTALLPGELVNLFLTCIEDPDKCAAFMKRATREDGEVDGEESKEEGGNYWTVVERWMYDTDDAQVTNEDLFGGDDVDDDVVTVDE